MAVAELLQTTEVGWFPPEPGTRYTVTMPTTHIDLPQAEDIRRLVYDAYHVWLPSPPDSDYDWNPNGVDRLDFWTWMTKRGTFPKRLAKYLKQNHEVVVSSDLLGQVGDIAGQVAKSATVYHWDVNFALDWQDGDFGDGGSCYWGGRSAARDMMRGAGAFALRCFSDPDDVWSGIARAWVYEVRRGVWVVWNGYGYSTLLMARLLALIVGGTYKRITLENEGTTDGTLWINGGAGYVVGSPADVESFPGWYDFGWEDPEGYTCCRCDARVDEDDLYTDDTGDTYCWECFSEDYTSCERCGDWVYRDDAIYCGDDPYCRYCANRYLGRCNDCDDYFLTEDLVYVEEEECDLCPDCHARYLREKEEEGHEEG